MLVQKKPFFRIKTLDVGKTYSVFNGKTFVNLIVTDSMLGFRFGQFVLTKRLGAAIHLKKKTRKTQPKKQ
jgi:ribosomal protein S19